ncbi:FCD domain-containing protein [Novosphingobium sp. KCTC 2891]|uniref:FadR/GntR family transcriptional regulator n=1 Tax=Novosphingobium sp. KCTC 2891 TaxID=2989730 RepID=UPI00222162F7|nr:FCD domain-containing protein [Novosphingobium sp. KCTC 2891]MCW1383640.1 FCD domain-containing protein [Novosphingobium sp. KCTC 2891]
MQHIGQVETLVARTARELAQLSLAFEDGDFIGAEADLLTRLGVSRPTLRQAAKIVENDCLLSVRRGIRGGFYASRPDADDAIRTLARYLRLRGTTLLDIMAVSRLVAEEAAMLACASKDDAGREELRRHAARVDEIEAPAQMIAAEAAVARIVARLSGNPAIELVMAIGYSFGIEEQGLELFRDPEHREISQKLQHGLCQAILDRDPEIARLMMRRRSEVMAGWIREALKS